MSKDTGALIDAELVEEGKGFESISRDALQDHRLSYKARGIMAYLKSKPPKWKTSTKAIAADSDGDGYEAVNNGLKELEAAGYLARLKRQGADRGRWEWLWVYGDNPRAVAARVARWEAGGNATVPRGGSKTSAPPTQLDDTTSDQAVFADDSMSGKPEHGEPRHGKPEHGSPDHGEAQNKREIKKRDLEEITTSSPTPAAPPRADVEELCNRLRDRMIENGFKAPTITKVWRDEARRMLDIDKRELDKALRLIDWATSNSFWKANIRSMPKFREQYDALRVRANEERDRRLASVGGSAQRSRSAVAVESTADAFARLRARRAAEGRALEARA
jgi:hypothetical protein